MEHMPANSSMRISAHLSHVAGADARQRLLARGRRPATRRTRALAAARRTTLRTCRSLWRKSICKSKLGYKYVTLEHCSVRVVYMYRVELIGFAARRRTASPWAIRLCGRTAAQVIWAQSSRPPSEELRCALLTASLVCNCWLYLEFIFSELFRILIASTHKRVPPQTRRFFLVYFFCAN